MPILYFVSYENVVPLALQLCYCCFSYFSHSDNNLFTISFFVFNPRRMCSVISYLFRISVNWFFPFMCTAQLKHANRWIPFCSFVWSPLSTHMSFQILFLHLAALLHLPMPCATQLQHNLLDAILIATSCSNEERGWTCTCTQQCHNIHHDPPSPENSNWVPRELKEPHTAHVLSNLPSPGHPPKSEPASRAERSKSWEVRNLTGSILPEPHKICSLFSCRKRAKWYFSGFSSTHYGCKHICAHLSALVSPSLARTQGTRRRDSHSLLEGRK